MSAGYKHWVVGFLFRNRSEVVLVKKTHPEWQKGKLNGVGGKIEGDESAVAAMRREFKEEAGVDVSDWREFALLKEKAGDVMFLVAHGDHEVLSTTDEEVAWYDIATLKSEPIMTDLAWLIPLALDEHVSYAVIDYNEPKQNLK